MSSVVDTLTQVLAIIREDKESLAAMALSGKRMDPTSGEALRCRCGVCRLCWGRELVAVVWEGRSPKRPEAVL